MSKQQKQFVIAKVHPWANSKSIPGTSASKVELLDIENDFKWCYTWVSESNWNYDQWEKIYNEDYNENAFVVEGMFNTKSKSKDLINADAKFTIIETANRQELLYLIAQKLGLI